MNLGPECVKQIRRFQNTFRTFADKKTVDYSQSENKLLKTEMIKKPCLAKKKIVEAMELRLYAAIDKTENMTRDDVKSRY